MAKVVWVLSTCVPGDNEPCLPAVFGSLEAARENFDKMMRAEWAANQPEDKETLRTAAVPGEPG